MRRLQYVATIAVAAIATAGAARPASAQLGGLVKKAKGAVEKKAATDAMGRTDLKPVDAYGSPLTAQSLDAVIRGMAASSSKVEESKAAQAEADNYNRMMTKAGEGHSKEIDQYRDADNKFESCESRFLEERNDAAAKAFQSKVMSDPATMQKYAANAQQFTMQYSKLVQAGDTAGARKLLMQQQHSLMGTDPKADTAAAIRKCGAPPAKPGYMVEEEKYRALWEAAQEKARKAETAARDAGLAASGMNAEKYALARERITNWLIEKNGGKPVQAFTNEERKAMEARNADIQKYKALLHF